jgi:hypothetical protein
MHPVRFPFTGTVIYRAYLDGQLRVGCLFTEVGEEFRQAFAFPVSRDNQQDR